MTVNSSLIVFVSNRNRENNLFKFSSNEKLDFTYQYSKIHLQPHLAKSVLVLKLSPNLRINKKPDWVYVLFDVDESQSFVFFHINKSIDKKFQFFIDN